MRTLEQTYYYRDVLKDSLPMRRDAAWFRNTFLREIKKETDTTS